MTNDKKSPAVELARKRREAESGDGVVLLSTGVRARIVPVGVNLIRDAMLQIEDPPVPWVKDEEKGQQYENPNDPEYQAGLARAARQRETASMDCMVMMGVELVDGVPQEDDWLRRLRFLEKRGSLDLSDYDLEDELDREFLYKKYVAVGSTDLIQIGQTSGISREEVAAAVASFPSDEEGVPD